MCKDNIAAYGRRTLPHQGVAWWLCRTRFNRLLIGINEGISEALEGFCWAFSLDMFNR